MKVRKSLQKAISRKLSFRVFDNSLSCLCLVTRFDDLGLHLFAEGSQGADQFCELASFFVFFSLLQSDRVRLTSL